MRNVHSFERTVLTKIKSGSHTSIYGGNMSGKTAFMRRLIMLSERGDLDEFTIHYLNEADRSGMEDFRNRDFREYFQYRVFKEIESIGMDTKTIHILCLDHMGLHTGDMRLLNIQEALQNNPNKNIKVLYASFNDEPYNAYGFVEHYKIPIVYTEFVLHDFKGDSITREVDIEYLDESDIVIFHANINKDREFEIQENDIAFIDDTVRGNRRHIIGVTHKYGSLVPRVLELKERLWMEDEVVLLDYGGRFFKQISSKELMTITQKMAEYGIKELVENILYKNKLNKLK